MKKIIYSIFAFTAITMASCGAAEATTEGEETTTTETKEDAPVAISGMYNTAETATISWKAKHYGDADYVHLGTVATNGNVIVENNSVIGGEFKFDILTLDEEGDTKFNKMLEGHLQDSTFFNTMIFPEATFKITGTEAGKIMGDLTVIGVTVPTTIEGEMTVTAESVSFVGTTTVDMLGFSMPFLLESEKAPEEEINESPDPKIIIDIDLKLAKAAM